MKNSLKTFLWLAALIGISLPAYSLTIIPTFDSTITGDPNALAMETGISNAIAVLQSNITDNLVVKIQFINDSSVGLGESSTWLAAPTYTQYRAALKSSARTINGTNALSKLPIQSTEPVTGGSSLYVALALADKLGLFAGFGSDGFDGTISINMSICNFSRPPASSSKFDLQQVAEHEMDEVLGTSSSLGSANPISPPDLFRYTTNLVRTYTTSGDNAYFSADGTNLIARYNMDASGDYGDWWSSTGVNWAPPGQTPHVQVQDAFTPPNTQADVGRSELTVLDVIGWTMAITQPPQLNITRTSANHYNLSWTNTATGFILQENTNLLSGTWQSSVSGSSNPAVLISTNTAKFYRLYSLSVYSGKAATLVTDQTAANTPLAVRIHRTNPY